MWPIRSLGETWTDAKVDNVAAAVRDFALRDGSSLDALRFQQKIGDYKAMFCGTPILHADAKEMAAAFEKCFDRRSPMIRLLDDPAWRESLKVAETPLPNCYLISGCPYYKRCPPDRIKCWSM